MSWRTPPNRRELTLILFALTVFILFYNLDTSLRLLGVDPASSQSALLSKFGLKTGIIGTDGRKPPGWRDKLEGEIFGDWGWEEGQVAGNGAEREKTKGGKEDKYGAIWLGQAKTGAGENQAIFGDENAGEAFVSWDDNVPTTKLVKHVPGTSDSLFSPQHKLTKYLRIHNTRFCYCGQWDLMDSGGGPSLISLSRFDRLVV